MMRSVDRVQNFWTVDNEKNRKNSRGVTFCGQKGQGKGNVCEKALADVCVCVRACAKDTRCGVRRPLKEKKKKSR